MGDLKVKMVPPDERSQAQREEDLLAADAKQKEELAAAAEKETLEDTVIPPVEEEIKEKDNDPILEITNDNVLSFIEKQTGNKFESIEQMLQKPEVQKEDLDPAVAAFKDYRERTGRSITDFVEANKDYKTLEGDDLLRNYYAKTNEDLDASDINLLLNDKYAIDEDDEEVDIQRKNIAKKIETGKARKFFETNQEQYKGVLESTAPLVPETERERYSAYLEQQKNADATRELQQKQAGHFKKTTEDLFSNNFEGFEFKIGENKSVKYEVEDVSKLREQQSNTMNFAKKHLDDNGMVKDSRAFHKAMLAANDPDSLFKFAYDKGMADAVKGHVTDAKNINMKPNNANNEMTNTGGFKVKAVDNGKRGTGGSLKINIPPQ